VSFSEVVQGGFWFGLQPGMALPKSYMLFVNPAIETLAQELNKVRWSALAISGGSFPQYYSQKGAEILGGPRNELFDRAHSLGLSSP
jgi:hypothetical protein